MISIFTARVSSLGFKWNFVVYVHLGYTTNVKCTGVYLCIFEKYLVDLFFLINTNVGVIF